MAAVIAVSGVKNSGKTTLIEKLIPALNACGVKTAVIFDGEKFQAVKFAAVTEKDLIDLYPEAELILLEGFKWTDYPKVELVRSGVSESPVCKKETLLALVTDTACRVPGVPTFGFEDVEDLADLLKKEARQ